MKEGVVILCPWTPRKCLLRRLLVAQHEVPFINKSEATKESQKGRETEKKTTNVHTTNRRSRVGLSTPFCANCGGSFTMSTIDSTVSLFSFKAVQLSDSISTIWSSIRLLSGKITKKQVFADRIFGLPRKRSCKGFLTMLLPKPVSGIAKTSFPEIHSLTAPSCSSFSIIFLLLRQIFRESKASSMVFLRFLHFANLWMKTNLFPWKD